MIYELITAIYFRFPLENFIKLIIRIQALWFDIYNILYLSSSMFFPLSINPWIYIIINGQINAYCTVYFRMDTVM